MPSEIAKGQLLLPITSGAYSAMSQSGLEKITCALLKARENARVQVAIGFGFASMVEKRTRGF